MLKPLVLAVALGFAAVSAGFAGEIVVPAAQATTPGDGGSSYPFDGDSFTRLHQVHRWRAFGPSSRLITGIAFRTTVHQDPIVYQCHVTITLSTTWRGPSSLSRVFDRNFGADATVVFSGTVVLDHPEVTPPLPPFEMLIPLDTPFRYKPGPFRNLLMEVRSRCLGDGEDDPGIDQVANGPLGSVAAIGSFPDELVQGFRYQGGVVTQFTTTP